MPQQRITDVSKSLWDFKIKRIMKVTFQEVLSRKTWLQKEMLNSLTGDIITKASEDQFYDVKLVINGVEIEPKIFNDIMNGIEKYIDAEAKELVKIKLEKAEYKVRKLDELISDASDKIREEFDLGNDQ